MERFVPVCVDLCRKNLTELPEIALNTTYLECKSNQLTSLPDLPPRLNNLVCSYNQITRLPTLPPTIWSLDANRNCLTEIPELPHGIKYLVCDFNQLTRLPVLPPTLSSLACSNNCLTELPELPPSMTFLSCGSNPIKHIPCLPRMLKSMYLDSPYTIPAIPRNVEMIVIRSMAKLDVPSFMHLIDHLPRLPALQFAGNPYRGTVTNEILNCAQHGFCMSVLKYMQACPYFDKTVVLNLIVKTHMISANLHQLPINTDMILHIRSFVF
jgi:Leucine-rich repeat (LRR) protein